MSIVVAYSGDMTRSSVLQHEVVLRGVSGQQRFTVDQLEILEFEPRRDHAAKQQIGPVTTAAGVYCVGGNACCIYTMGCGHA